MKYLKTERRRALAGLVAVAMLTLLLNSGTLYAAGETLVRGAIVATGGTMTASGITMRSIVGQPVTGVRSAGSTSLCSGAGCPNTSLPDDNPTGPTSWSWLPLIGGE